MIKKSFIPITIDMKEKPPPKIPKEESLENSEEQLTEQQLIDMGLLKLPSTPEEVVLNKDAIKKGFEALSIRE